ncbi:hypothetical protein TEA_009687 [Camellia sinensis var. sinensis]|uniref:Uncharacterized protein n=1 Tax=Camellia sinensis var. sinensis TaxID=542762 RepID=A0A4S4EJT7_CAMSN|nr:hypothetical protein TEA_009687 [Camellia sinensis var. sinensis]
MFGTLQGTINQPNISSIGDDGALECGTTDADVGLNSESKLVVHEETVVMSTDVSHVVKPLNFDEFNSTAELEETPFYIERILMYCDFAICLLTKANECPRLNSSIGKDSLSLVVGSESSREFTVLIPFIFHTKTHAVTT